MISQREGSGREDTVAATLQTGRRLDRPQMERCSCRRDLQQSLPRRNAIKLLPFSQLLTKMGQARTKGSPKAGIDSDGAGSNETMAEPGQTQWGCSWGSLIAKLTTML